MIAPPMGKPRVTSVERLHVLGLATLLFTMACVMPALFVAKGETRVSLPGGYLLIMGWGGLFDRQFAWLANPIAAASAILLVRRRYTGAAVVSAVALLLALHAVALLQQFIVMDDTGTEYRVERLGVGFFLWTGSLLVVLVGSIVLRFREGRAKVEGPPEGTPWYDSGPFLLASLLFCFPVALMLFWTNPKASTSAKLAVAAALVILVLISAATKS
jgi:hypothetical protein